MSLLILPGTVYPLIIDGLAPPLVSLRDRIPIGQERLRAPTADTYLRFIVTYKVRLPFDVSRRAPGLTDGNAGKEGISDVPSYGRTTRTQEDAEPAQDRLPHEGQLAPERAQAARNLA